MYEASKEWGILFSLGEQFLLRGTACEYEEVGNFLAATDVKGYFPLCPKLIVSRTRLSSPLMR